MGSVRGNSIVSLYLVAFFLSIASVHAALGSSSIVNSLGVVGDTTADLLTNRGVLFFLTFTLFFVLLYGVFSAAINQIKVFKTDGSQPTRPGKLVAASLAMLSAVGLAWWVGYSPHEFTERVLGIAGWLGGVAFALLIGGMTYYNLKGRHDEKTWPLTFLTMGFSFVTYGLLLDRNEAVSAGTLFDFGWLFILIGLVWMLVAGNKSATNGNGGGVVDRIKDAFGGDNGGSGGGSSGGSSTRVGKPGNPVATCIPDGRVHIGWGHASGDVDGYHVQRRVKTTFGSTKDVEIGDVSSNEAIDEHRITDFSKEYVYEVSAIGTDGKRGPSVSTRLVVPKSNVSGSVFYFDAEKHPIENLSVKLSGATEEGPVPTDAQGRFMFHDVPRMQGLHTIEITDPEGVYVARTLAEVVDLNNDGGGDVTVNDIGLEPGNAKAELTGQVVDDTGAPLAQDFIFHVVGGFGKLEQQAITDPKGHFILRDIPAGYFAEVICEDPKHTLRHANSPGALLRKTKGIALPESVKMQSKGNYSVSGVVEAYNHHMKKHFGVEKVMVSLNRNGNSYKALATSDAEGKFIIEHIDSGTYEVKADHTPNQYQVHENSSGTSIQVNRDIHDLRIKMIPQSPIPIRIERKGGNNAEVTFR